MEGLETFFTASQQLRLFLMSCLMGVPAGMVYDAFRTLRAILPHNRIAVAVEDILFFLLYAAAVMSFTVSAARSEFRFFFCFGSLLGFILYHFTIGNAVVGILKRVILKIKGIFGRIFRPVREKIVLLCRKKHLNFVRSLQNIRERKKIAK